MHCPRAFLASCLLGLSVLCAATLPSCTGGSGQGGEARNLILVSVDTLRADHLGCYGYDRETSPRIDALAERGTLFEDASSTGSWTVPSHMSMLTGTYTRTHGIDGYRKALPEEVRTLAGVLKDRGYATGALVNVHLLNEEKGFDRGFDDYTIVPPSASAMGATKRIVNGALSWIQKHRDRPFFLFLHFYDVHSDFDPLPSHGSKFKRGEYRGPANGSTAQLRAYRKEEIPQTWGIPEAEHLIDLYDGGIHQFDADMGTLLDFLEQDEIGAETLLVVTADHGEEFLEHGGIMHGRTLYQELLHIPLIFAGPGVPAGRRIQGGASLVDVMPTALSLLGQGRGVHTEGVDLSAAWKGEESWQPDRLIFAEADKWLSQEDGNFRRSVRKGRYKLYYDKNSGKTEVFDLETDPDEKVDISEQEPVLLKALWGEMERFIEGKVHLEEGDELTEEELEQLRALGYGR